LRLVHDPLAGVWEVHDDRGCLARSAIVVVAGAADSVRLEPLRGLPLRQVRGQISFVPATPESHGLRAVLCGETYLAPARGGLHTVGATFTREAHSETTVEDHAENLSALARLAPAMYAALGGRGLDAARLDGRAALRCVSPDYLPAIGAVSDSTGAPLPGLFVSTAHGSRGLITTPLAGEVLAGLIEAGPAPLPQALLDAIAPTRFCRPSRPEQPPG
jgi:tRNA 5-methylaminomethyl-2-thiouridine biosynthesis bifunctional protein